MIYLIALNICLLCVVVYQLTRKREKPLNEVKVMYSDKIEATGHFQYKTDGAACFDIKSPARSDFIQESELSWQQA